MDDALEPVQPEPTRVKIIWDGANQDGRDSLQVGGSERSEVTLDVRKHLVLTLTKTDEMHPVLTWNSILDVYANTAASRNVVTQLDK